MQVLRAEQLEGVVRDRHWSGEPHGLVVDQLQNLVHWYHN
jgi:hypothetical protein